MFNQFSSIGNSECAQEDESTVESTALWAEHPHGLQEILVRLSALLPLFSVQLRHKPFTWPISFLFSIKEVGLF